VLFGVVNPSGRLAESIPLRLEDTASFLNFPGEKGHVRYGEGLFVGYRDFDARDAAVSFPFGHGLSYTTFGYSGLSVLESGDGIEVSVTVTNTGERDGREVVQVYVSVPGSSVQRPIRELKGFANVAVAAGSAESVVIRIAAEDLAFYDVAAARWTVEGGEYLVSVGASSRDLRATASVELAGDAGLAPLTIDSTIGEWLQHPAGSAILLGALSQGDAQFGGMLQDPGMRKMVESMPLARVAAFPGSPVTRDQLGHLVAAANGEAAAG
jgi:beta-glucosidase